VESARLEPARWELGAAVEELRSLAANVSADVPRKALASLYFTAFHLVQALLASRGVAAHTHNGVQVAFSLHFVKPGTISKSAAKLFSELQAVRERADYQVDLSYDSGDMRRHLESARPLVEELLDAAGATPGLEVRAVREVWANALASVMPARAKRRQPRRRRQRTVR
jgi:uncharacterized protein (UPF0332 family)